MERRACRAVVLLVVLAATLALAGRTAADPQAAYAMKTGSYVGDGQNPRSITGIGFQPDLVIIKGNVNNPGVARSSTMVGDASKPLGTATGLSNKQIRSLDPDGFTIGDDHNVNQSGITYYWTAFRAASGQMVVSSYTGNGSNNRTISGLGLQPAYMIVLPERAQHAGQRFNYEGNDASLRFDASGEAANRIRSFVSDGFVVGSDNSVNESARVFHYVAWAEQAGIVHSGTYPGNAADNRDITVVGFQPSFFITKGGWGVNAPVCRSAAMTGDLSLYLDHATGFSNAVQRFLANGFQLGSHSSVNNWSEAFHYVAFLESAAPGADLGVSMSVDSPNPNVGDTIQYTVTVLNNGPATGTGIALTDVLPAGLTHVSSNAGQGSYSNTTGIWTVGSLSAGSSAALSLSASVDSGTGGRTITNTASVSAADQTDTVPANNTASVSIIVRSADLAVAKGVDRPTPNVGETIQYTVTLTNNGPSPATGVAITDLLPTGVTFVSSNPSQGSYGSGTGLWTIGALAQSASASLILTATVNADAGGSTITNVATVTAADQPDPVPANNTASASIHVQSADLGLAKSVDRSTPNVGETIHYTVTLTNNGPDNSTGVAVTDVLPVGVTFTSANASRGSYTAGTGVWSVGDLNTGSTATLTLTAAVASGTSGRRITNVAAVTAANQADPTSGNNTASVNIDVAGADLAVAKSVNNPSPDEGDQVTYSVTVSNSGPNGTSGVVLTDLLPAGVTYVSSTPSRGSYIPGTGLWSIGDMAQGATATLSLTASVNAGTSGSVIVNTAQISASTVGDPASANNSASATITVQGADLALALSVDRPTPTMGETIHYTVTLTNRGPYGATGVAVTDQIPGGLTYVSNSASQGSYASGTGRWSVGSLGLGSSATLTLAATVNAGTVGQTITDVANVAASDQGDPNAGNNSASVAFTVAGADLALTMVVDNATPRAGDPVRYTLTLASQGPNNSTGVVVTDLLPASLTYLSSNPSRGSYAAGTGQWTVGNLTNGASATLVINASVNADADGATITNTATITAANPADPASGNNLASSQIQVQEALPGIRVTIRTQSGATLLPGASGIEVFNIILENTSTTPTSLNTLTVANRTTGHGTAAQLDANWSTLSLGVGQVGENGGDTVIGRATFRAGAASFGHLAVALDPGSTLMLTVFGGASINARTGDLLDIRITGAESFSFSSPVSLTATWPLDPAGSFPVRGISAVQIASTPVPLTTVFTGEIDRLAMSFVAPCNGYESDILETIRLENLGDAQPLTDIGAMKVWMDGGNGGFDEGAGDDILLGSAIWNGTVWALTGLSAAVPIGGLRLYVSVNIHQDATPERTVRLALPQTPNDGLEMAAGGSGPVDASVANPDPLVILEGSVNVITVSAEQPTRRFLLPGGDLQELIRLQLVNFTAKPETLRTLTFENTTTGPGTRAQLDQDWGAVSLESVGGDKSGRDSTYAFLGSSSFAGGRAAFRNLGVIVEPRQTLAIVLRAAASLNARDGDDFDLRLTGVEDLEFSRAVSLAVEWPLDPAGSFVVDGMAADQITVHPTPVSSFTAGSTRNLVFDATLPPNGYEEDRLTRLDLVNLGTATPGADISMVEIWVDDGDGRFESDQDRGLGSMVNTGERWEITGLSERVPVSGLRVFATVDVSSFATEGHLIRFGLPSGPDVAVGMVSGNDGPLDRAVEDATSHVISGSDRFTVVAEAIDPGVVHPGDRGIVLLHLVMTNTYDAPRTLTGVTFTNVGTGIGARSDLDSECDVVTLHTDNGDDGVFDDEGTGPGLATVAFSGGKAVMRGFSLDVAPHTSSHLFLTADVSTKDATDGDVLAAILAEPLDMTFLESIGAVAEWPIDSGARWTVDGMVTRQIVNYGSGVATLGPGQGPAVALDFSVPSNGYAEDLLAGVRLRNMGTAGPTQIAELALWRDGGDGVFSPTDGSDLFLGTLTWIGDGWSSGPLSERLPLNGARFFVSVRAADVISQPATVQLAVPLNGLVVQSNNDGPIDQPLQNPDVILLSSAPLLTTLTTVPYASTAGGLFDVRMVVQNVSDETIAGIAPSPFQTAGPIVVEVVDGPTPAGLTLAPGESGLFEWTCTANVAGETRFTGFAEGTGETTEAPQRSLDSSSGTHFVYTQAEELELFAVSTPPYSVNRGQTDVVPLSLTYRNPGGERGSSVKLTGLRIRLEDELGRGIVPAEILSRISVREGNRIYLVKGSSSLETSGAEVDLTLATPVVITTFEPATLNLQLDVSPTATAATFRALIQDGSWFEAEDVTNHAPVTLDLKDRTYPIRSGLAHLVAEATKVEVSKQDADTVRVGPGQQDVTLLALTLQNVGIEGISSEVRVGSFGIEVVDNDGVPLADPSSLLRAIRVRTLLQTLIDRPVGDGETPTLQFVNPLTLPVNTPITLTIAGDIAEGVAQGAFRIRLQGEAFFDIRDGNTSNPVPAQYLSSPMEGNAVIIERAATAMAVRGVPTFPSVVTVGERDVTAMTGMFRHPGTPGTSRIRPVALTVECRNEERAILDPSIYLSKVGLFVGEREVASVTDLTSLHGSVELPIDGVVLDPEETAAFRLVVSISASAPAAYIELVIPAPSIRAADANTGVSLVVEPEAGAELPLFSGVTRLKPPARELVVGLESLMPAAIAADGRECAAASLSLSNPAPQGSGSISVDHLRVRAAGGDGSTVSLGGAALRLAAYEGGSLRGASAALTPDSTMCILVFSSPLVVEPGGTVTVEVRLRPQDEATVPQLRLGWDRADIGIVQPEGALLAIEARTIGGRTFPLWTESGSFGSKSLEESYGNFPNPFGAGREETSFVYYLPSDALVTLRIWSSRGEAVITLLDGQHQAAGLHQSSQWNGRNGRGSVVVNGVYVAELIVQTDDGEKQRLLRKVAVVR